MKEKIEIQINGEAITLNFLGDKPCGYSLTIDTLKKAIDAYLSEKAEIKAVLTSSLTYRGK